MVQLTTEQKQQYEEQGFVLLRGLLQPDELQPLIREIEAAVDRLAREYLAEGRLTGLHAEQPFITRFLKLVEDCPALYPELTGSRLMGPALFELLRHPKLVDLAESVVGPEVHCEGRHRLRPKLPNFEAADFRWHEDTLYQARRITYVEQQFGLGADDPRRHGTILSRIVAAPQMAEPGFWVPLVAVDETNGCLELLPGGHRHTPPDERQWEPGRFVPQLEGLTPVAVPMRVGDALFIHQHCPHNSPPNRSDHIRWSVDIRYQDGRLPVKSAREPGFLARSVQRPHEVVTTYEGYARIREAAATFAATPGIRL
jgi:phytanoyl-CoA hydroxylase